MKKDLLALVVMEYGLNLAAFCLLCKSELSSSIAYVSSNKKNHQATSTKVGVIRLCQIENS